MSSPRVLAVIPTYNSATHIEKTLVSLLKQDYPHVRRVVIDDCSGDGTAGVLSRYRDVVEVLRNETNSGLAYGLNRGLSLAGDEDLFFILEDDVELVDADYISRAVKHFEDGRIALVCGQAVDFSRERLSLEKRAFARYLNLDYVESGVTEISYSLIKADLIRTAALLEIGGFGYAGNPKLGAEDQILAKNLRAKGYRLIKDASLRYRLEFARTTGLRGFLRSEANAGRTLGVAVGGGLISVSPVASAETKAKSNFRRTQVIVVALAVLSLVLLAVFWQAALAVLAVILAAEAGNYIRKSRGFKGREKLYFAAVGLLNDFNFALSFYRGFVSGLAKRGRR